MPPRASWKGFINLSLVSVPVKAYTASNTGNQIRLNQLHAKCNSRVKQQLVCPVCGEIPRDEIVKGYEYAKNQYVVIDLDELDKLRAEDDGRAIRIDTFVSPDAIDPIYYSETNYYLVPDGAAGQKSYALLHRAMKTEQIHSVAKVVLHKKEHLVLIRPVESLLCMTTLRYSSEIKSPASFEDELLDTKVTSEEFALAKTLIQQSTTEPFDLSPYQDEYSQKLTRIIEAKVNDQEIVAPPAAESTAPVLNLMEALRASVSRSASPIQNKGRKSRTSRKKAAQASKTSTPLAEELAKPTRKKARKRKSG